MSKRFTDTDKWKKNSFSELSPIMKLVWVYLCDNCDHAGIWEANFKLLSFQLGCEVTREEFEQAFGDKIKFISTAKVFIPSFVEFQYGELSQDNRAHLSVIRKLEKEGAYKGHVSPIQGAKDKDKDKEMDKEGGVGETISTAPPELQDDLTTPFLAKVKPGAQAAWIQTYGDRAWIKTELMKAVAWIHANPKRAPKSDYGRFFNNWLSQGWEKYRKSLATAQGPTWQRRDASRPISFAKTPEQVQAEAEAFRRANDATDAKVDISSLPPEFRKILNTVTKKEESA